jgi:hypothetical protein
LSDKNFVSAFLKHAGEIFATARTAGTEGCDLSILVSREGGIHMIAGAIGNSNRCAPTMPPAQPIASIEPMAPSAWKHGAPPPRQWRHPAAVPSDLEGMRTSY